MVKITLADKVKLSLAGGGDLVANGDFSTVTTGWTAGASAILASAGAGKSGNCLSITENGATVPYAYQVDSVNAGRRYKMTCYIKAGTENQYTITIYDVSNSASIYASETLTESAGDWSTDFSYTFTAPAGCSQVRLYLNSRSLNGEGKVIYFDSVTLKEIPTKVTLA